MRSALLAAQAGSSFFPIATFHEPSSVFAPGPTHVESSIRSGSYLHPDSDYWCEARNTRSAHVRSRSLLAKDRTLAAVAATASAPQIIGQKEKEKEVACKSQGDQSPKKVDRYLVAHLTASQDFTIAAGGARDA